MIQWQSIDTVFLDMDGTLLDLNFDNHFWLDFVPERYALQHKLTIENAKNKLFPKFKALEGKLEWYCLDYWSQELKLDLAEMKLELSGLIAVLPHVTEFLEALRTTGKRIILATNAHEKSLGLKMEKTCLRPFFDRIISSHGYGHPKENQPFWEHLQNDEPFDPKRTLLVDDSLPVLRAARDYGLSNTIAILKNDSTKAPKDGAEFPAIYDFREIMPHLIG